MADVHPDSARAPDGKSSSGLQDSVFVVENTDMDLGSLFASIDKKESASPEESATLKAPAHPDPVMPQDMEPSVRVNLEEEKSPKRRLLVLLLLGVTFAAAGIMGARQLFFRPSLVAAPKPSQVRHSIVVPGAVERLEVFFIAQSKEKEDLLLMTLAVHAGRPNAEEVLPSARVAMRDVVYGFLSQQHPEKNVRRSWAPIVEKELLAELQKRFPQVGIVTVELEELQKI